ncbi:hypothetical protein DPMN_003200 [Dreissena polymorpha]|uniref:Uncharacterized protein n=1 Tax=Dreissena polymorpha TaxID=45954 RepID=A0A9D4RUK0_DREPO|nr:hypothetical protein DPMN_003200 [Dreissena polymorpha]
MSTGRWPRESPGIPLQVSLATGSVTAFGSSTTCPTCWSRLRIASLTALTLRSSCAPCTGSLRTPRMKTWL